MLKRLLEKIGIKNAQKFSNKIIDDEEWINVYIRNAVEDHLWKSTYTQFFKPEFQRIARIEHPSEKDFVKAISNAAEQNYGDRGVKRIINAIARYIQFESKKEGFLPHDTGFYNSLACTLLGRYFFLTADRIGQI